MGAVKDIEGGFDLKCMIIRECCGRTYINGM